MLVPFLIRERGRALVTAELSRIEGLHDKAVDFIAQVYLCPAVRASVFTQSPLLDARAAAKLVAILALFGLLDDHEADCAGKVLIEGL